MVRLEELRWATRWEYAKSDRKRFIDSVREVVDMARKGKAQDLIIRVFLCEAFGIKESDITMKNGQYYINKNKVR